MSGTPSALDGYWPSRWPAEDGGPRRTQAPRGGPGLGIRPGERLEILAREAIAATMVVLRDPGEAYLLRHTFGDTATSRIERFDPAALAPIERSPDLEGGPMWPGGVAAHANGSLYVVFGRHAHRLSPDCSLIASRRLPRDRPYNSFVVLPDGHLATKDFGGARPGEAPSSDPAELLILEPDRLDVVARLELPERSIARLSAHGDGSERYAGTLRGQGLSKVPLHLVRVDLATAAVELAEICGRPNGLIANPPAIDVGRSIAVGYDSGNGVVTAFSFGDGVLTPRWSREQNHACHPLLFPDTGELVTADHDADRMMEQVVLLDIETGSKIARADTGSAVQSVLFPSIGFDRDVYLCSFATLSRVTVV